MDKAALESLREALAQPYDLKQRHSVGQQRYQRMWMTIEVFNPFGDLQARVQWRGDLCRVAHDVDSSGRAREKVTWRSVGVRSWLLDEDRYDHAKAVPFAEGFSYDFSAEDDYDELTWDYSSIPREPLGRSFRTAFSVSAHLEFDFLRSTRHVSIEKLRHIGEVITHTPEEGKTFSIDFPPFFTNSCLNRKHVQVGFLGLTLADAAVCALLDVKQGPQDFFWHELVPSPDDASKAERLAVRLKSWQDGVLSIRMADGSLVSGEFTEWHMIKRVSMAGGNPVANHSRGIWSIQEITAQNYGRGLEDWATEQTPTPQFRPEIAPQVKD